jgi:hypothetical protein
MRDAAVVLTGLLMAGSAWALGGKRGYSAYGHPALFWGGIVAGMFVLVLIRVIETRRKPPL